MKSISCYFILILQLICVALKSQSLPTAIDTSIHISVVMEVKPNAVRMARCTLNNAIYYATADGNLYKIRNTSGVYSDSLVATSAVHNINYLRGLIFKDSSLYLIGNRTVAGSQGYGLIMRGKFHPNLSLTWDTIMHTAFYANSATTYDHSFSCICLSLGGDSLYFSSGSRTDHGEAQTSSGLFPGMREVGLTSAIFRIPINPSATIYLPNDSAALAASGYVYCRGTRNSFDLQIAPNGDLLGCENSGDRDDPDELNWLQTGKHYGFPWRMGGNLTGQQFLNYDQNTDLLINHQCHAWKKSYFYNDPSYPQPTGITFTEPVKNYGPDADKFRDQTTGLVRDASDEGSFITSFTSHRCPLGLVFDGAGKLAAPYYHSAFMMSYTQGTIDSSGFVGNGMGPFVDLSQDLLQLALFKDTASGQYSMNCYRIAWGFIKPVDAYLDNNILYVLETHPTDTAPKAKLYSITFPLNSSSSGCAFLGNDASICKGASLTIMPDLKGQFKFLWSNGATTSQITVSPAATTSYWLKINNGITTSTDTVKVTVKSIPNATITSTGPTTFCSGTNPLTLTANTGSYTYKWKKGPSYLAATAQTYAPSATGTYKVEVTKVNGCSKLSPGVAVTVNTLPAATITTQGSTTFCAGDSVVLAANSGAGLTYKWKNGSSLISGATGVHYTAKTAGTYKVIVTNVNNCSKTSTGKVVTVNCREGFETAVNTVEVFPNPTDGLVTLKFNSDLNQECKVTVKDITGRELMSKSIAVSKGDDENQIDIRELASGSYFMEVKIGAKEEVVRLVKE